MSSQGLGCYIVVSEQVGQSGQVFVTLSVFWYAICVWNIIGACLFS